MTETIERTMHTTIVRAHELAEQDERERDAQGDPAAFGECGRVRHAQDPAGE